MFSKFKPISISLSPNVEKDDIRLALNLIIRPWLWIRQKRSAHSGGQEKKNGIERLESEFKEFIGVKYAFSFNSGRSALYAILKSLDLPARNATQGVAGGEKGSNVLLQAFTCNAAVNPILWQDLSPIYIDCDENSFNIDINDLTLKLASLSQDKRPKVLMVQHTFGLPVNMDEILAIVRQNNLILIEDCAHALGAEYKNQKVGSFGKASFFSFSRDKIISSVYGGMVVTNDPEIAKKIQQIQRDIGSPSYFWIFQQLLHPILLNFIILPIYNFLDLGKIFLVLSQLLHVLSKAVHWKEKRGVMPDYFPKAMPNALAVMALNQFLKLDRFYNRRKEISKFYYENLKETSFSVSDDLSSEPSVRAENEIKHSLLRFTIKHEKAHKIIYEAWKNQNILIGDWYTTPIAPADTKLDEMHYKRGSCPTAEKLSKRTLNLPTHINISKKDAEKIINFLKKFA